MLPVIDAPFTGIYDALLLPLRERIIATALKLDIFSCLTRPREAADLARQINADPSVCLR